MTVRALLSLLDEIDHEGGPEAARQNRLHLTSEGTHQPMTTAPAPRPPATGIPLTASADVRLRTPAQATEQLPVGQLLKWGADHPDTDVQAQAERARAALTGLRMRHAADLELSAITTEREQLEKRLAEIQAREAELAPPKKKAGRRASPSYDAKAVRTWAAENGVDCPRVGRVPKTVLDRWRSATS